MVIAKRGYVGLLIFTILFLGACGQVAKPELTAENQSEAPTRFQEEDKETLSAVTADQEIDALLDEIDSIMKGIDDQSDFETFENFNDL